MATKRALSPARAFSRAGRIEEAEGGTLFLDEIAELLARRPGQAAPCPAGAGIGAGRRQSHRSRPTCGSSPPPTATWRPLVEAGLFRQDLYYRINVFPIVLPPFRDRKDDILLLADHFAARYAQRLGKDVRRISTQAINMMAAYHWPGNVRELENCIEYAVLLSRDNVIHGHNLPPTLQMPDADDSDARSIRCGIAWRCWKRT